MALALELLSPEDSQDGRITEAADELKRWRESMKYIQQKDKNNGENHGFTMFFFHSKIMLFHLFFRYIYSLFICLGLCQSGAFLQGCALPAAISQRWERGSHLVPRPSWFCFSGDFLSLGPFLGAFWGLFFIFLRLLKQIQAIAQPSGLRLFSFGEMVPLMMKAGDFCG